MIDDLTPIDVFLDRGFPLNRHQAEMLFSTATLLEAPPEEANFRSSESEAQACWNCTNFNRTGTDEETLLPLGECQKWEARVQGDGVCDSFEVIAIEQPAPPPPTPPAPPSDRVAFSVMEVFMPDGEVEFSDEDGVATKTIMRTGEWDKTPFSTGTVKKKLKIVRDGVSSLRDNVISLSELVDSFKRGAYENVMVPLSDERRDHPKERGKGSNLMRLNTGFVRDLWIEDLADGVSRLKAKIQFTEPEVREKVKNGTYPDVSPGVFFGVQNTDGDYFNSAINHVILTPRPFMSGLGSFEFSDEQPETVDSFVPAGTQDKYVWDDSVPWGVKRDLVQGALDGLELSDQELKDVAGDRALIFNSQDETYRVAFISQEGGEVTLSPVDDWHAVEIEASVDDEQPEEPEVAPEPKRSKETPLQRAQRLRKQRTTKRSSKNRGGVNMAVDIESVDFSNEEQVKEAMEELVSENQTLQRDSRKGDVTAEVQRVSDMGFSECPGFLARYRDILLSDDGGEAIVFSSHDEDGNNVGSAETMSATELVKGLIETLPTDDKGKVLFSGQHLDTGNTDPPPPHDPVEGDQRSVEERTAAAAKAIGQDMPDSGKE